MKEMLVRYNNLNGEYRVPVKEVGDTVEGRPQHNPFATTPKGYLLFLSYAGWEEGHVDFLAPEDVSFQCVSKGSAHSSSVWKLVEGQV